MKRMILACLIGVLVVTAPAPAAKKTPKQALTALQDLIGSWKGTSIPKGTYEERQRGFWQEEVGWQWQFKDKDAWLRADLDKGKHYTRFELHYQPANDKYRLEATTADKKKLTFEGT